MKPVTPLSLAAIIAVFSAALEARDVLSSPQVNDEQSLLASCQTLGESKTNRNISACRYYIYGFVDAIQATDGMRGEALKGSDNHSLSYTERAYRTRVGKLEDRTQASQLNYFCVPQGEAREQLMDNLAAHMRSSIETSEQLKTTVYSALTEAYPCR